MNIKLEITILIYLDRFLSFCGHGLEVSPPIEGKKLKILLVVVSSMSEVDDTFTVERRKYKSE